MIEVDQTSKMAWVVASEDATQNPITVEISTPRGISTIEAAAVLEKKPADLDAGLTEIGSFPAEDVIVQEPAA